MKVQLSVGGGSGKGWYGDAEGDVLTGIENLVGSAFGDTLIGDKNDNVIDGGRGKDVLEGWEGNDTLWRAALDLNDILLHAEGIAATCDAVERLLAV